MSPLQAYLLLNQVLHGILAKLVAWPNNEAYISVAAGYAEALALSPYCHDNLPQERLKPHSCFDQAALKAVRYYRQLQDKDGVRRMTKLVDQHPNADKSLYDEL
jgi:hypothetical protein